jgi:hypothetical protein
MYAGLAFAGGGNRCYWQGGFYETVAPRIGLKPKRVVGASAGALAMLYTALGLGPYVRQRVHEAFLGRASEMDWAGFRKGGRLFPVGDLYHVMLTDLFTAERLAQLQTQADFRIAVAEVSCADMVAYRGAARRVDAVLLDIVERGLIEVHDRLHHPHLPKAATRAVTAARLFRRQAARTRLGAAALPRTSASSNSAAMIARSRAARSSLALSSVSSMPARAPGSRPVLTKSSEMTSARGAWRAWS